VEQIFRDSMTIHGVNVEQSTVPISIDISDGEKLSTDPNVFPVKVNISPTILSNVRIANKVCIQVVLNHIGPQTANGSADQAQLHETEGHTEVVRAKFVVGCDGDISPNICPIFPWISDLTRMKVLIVGFASTSE
jgi:hypothetical protein